MRVGLQVNLEQWFAQVLVNASALPDARSR